MMQVEGRNPIIELLKSKRFIKKIIMQKGLNRDDKVKEILKRAQSRKVYIQEIDKKKVGENERDQ